MADVTVDVVNNLVSTESLAYMRAIPVRITAKLLKPDTKMYAYFDGVDVNRYFKQDGKEQGEQLVTDANGEIVATFNIPGYTFTAGEKELVLSDSDNYNSSTILGSTDVRAKTTFKSTGILERWQATQTTTTNVTVEQIVRIEVPVPVPRWIDPAPVDPLAQSFFTYGIEGGVFITGIDLYFQSKDSTLPVWVELREMVNGYPTLTYINQGSVAYRDSGNVAISDNASLPTRFTFDDLVFLEPDKDYCFVVQSRSNRYNVWTAKMSETSKETGKIVFNQPYVGSLFKSENNRTWTAEQNEDIKFTLYRAKFNTGVEGSLNFAASSSPVRMPCTSFATFAGSGYVYANFGFKHGLDNNSKIGLACNTYGTYNGIPGNLLNQTHTVFDVQSEYVVGFIVSGANATSTGKITTGGIVRDIQVDNQGTNYSNVTLPSITLSGFGSGASATPVVKDGKLVDIILDNGGSGYNTAPTVSITGAVGTGANATAIIEETFLVSTNRFYHAMNPSVAIKTPSGTSISSTMDTTLGAFTGGTIQSYDPGKTYEVDLNKYNVFDNNLMLASRYNEYENLADGDSALVNVKMSTSNDYVSPTIDYRNARATFIANSVNNQPNDSLNTSNAFGVLATITVNSGGSGYTNAPNVLIYGGSGSNAFATCNLSGNSVHTVTIQQPGWGFFEAPAIFFVGGNATVNATATATITPYNSELMPTAGSAESRYITKKQKISTLSSGIRVFVTAYSNADSNFDVYIKTTLSSENIDHDSRLYRRLISNVERNKSTLPGEYLEYEFYLDNIPDFDTYNLKFVLRSQTPWDPPIIDNFRAIIAAK